MATKKKYAEIEFAGKKLPVFYGLRDLSAVQKTQEEIENDVLGYWIDVVWQGVQSGHKKAGLNLDLDKEEFADMIDESPEGFSDATSYFRDRQEAFMGGFQEKKS